MVRPRTPGVPSSGGMELPPGVLELVLREEGFQTLALVLFLVFLVKRGQAAVEVPTQDNMGGQHVLDQGGDVVTGSSTKPGSTRGDVSGNQKESGRVHSGNHMDPLWQVHSLWLHKVKI